MKDSCVICQKETDVDKSTPVAERTLYVEGCGQVCWECWKAVYGT